MGYSGARGGLEAILAAEDLVRRSRDHAPAPWVSTGQITARFRLAVDRVMGEAGLYREGTAADAFRQAEGDVLEARTWCGPTAPRCRGSRSASRWTQTRWWCCVASCPRTAPRTGRSCWVQPPTTPAGCCSARPAPRNRWRPARQQRVHPTAHRGTAPPAAILRSAPEG